MMKDIKNTKSKIWLILFSIVSFLFVMPSIFYLLEHKTIYDFEFEWTYFFKLVQGNKWLNAIIFFILFSLIFGLYFRVLKKQKQCFKSQKQIFAFIIGISMLFLMVIPHASKDVYSYIGNGWIAAHYHENPYYQSTGQVAFDRQIDDPMFHKIAEAWKYETVVYGPLWTLICTIFSWLSFGGVFKALIIFKIANLIIHIANCMLIYKITKKNIHVLLYGLNPLILFEGLSNVHNDIYIVFFILLAIYFVKTKKNLFFAVACIAMATAIKYLPILILPFLVIYYVKDREVKERFKICIYCGIEDIAIIGLFYALYLNDFQVFLGIFIQQKKYANSLFLLLFKAVNGNLNRISALKNVTFGVFAIAYVCIVVKLLFSKKMRLQNVIRKYNTILLIFTFVLVTNFNSWYMMWFFPTLCFLKGKSIKNVIYLSYTAEIANLISWVLFLKIPYFITMMSLAIGLNIINHKKLKMKG